MYLLIPLKAYADMGAKLFTSQHVSINSLSEELGHHETSTFTSQHVSINSMHQSDVEYIIYAFTSQHVSINSIFAALQKRRGKDLHPNMYLLIQKHMCQQSKAQEYLHPNMYLLIPLMKFLRECLFSIYIPTCIY